MHQDHRAAVWRRVTSAVVGGLFLAACTTTAPTGAPTGLPTAPADTAIAQASIPFGASLPPTSAGPSASAAEDSQTPDATDATGSPGSGASPGPSGGASTPAPSAPAGPPKLTVALNISKIGGWDAANWLGFTFTSTQATESKGLVRVTDPYLPFPHNGGTLSLTLPPVIQNTDSTAPGYFRVEKGTCKSAKLSAFHASPDQGVEQTIDAVFDCLKGQHFRIDWFPRTLYYVANGDPNGTEGWDFPVATRRTTTDPWTALPKPHLDITGVPLVIGPLPTTWIDAPKMLASAVDQTPPLGPATYIFGTAGWVQDGIRPLQTTLTVVEPVRIDTGELVLVADVVKLRRQQTLAITDCIDAVYGYCADAPFGVVEVSSPVAGTFTDLLGNVLSSQTAVEFGVGQVSTLQGSWDAAKIECGYDGGEFSVPGVFVAWNCAFGSTTPGAWVDHARSDLTSPAYCPSGNVTFAFSTVTCEL